MASLLFRYFGRRVIGTLVNARYLLCGNRIDLGYKARIIQGSFLEGYNKIHDYAVFGGSLGRHSYIGANSHVCARVGRFCSIGPNVKTITTSHPISFVSTHPVFYSTSKQSGISFVNRQMYKERESWDSIKIGNDVFIGDSVIILAGISIGDGAVIGAGSVVTRDIESYSIVVGNPAKQIGKRFSQEAIDYLITNQWWNKTDEQLRNDSDYMLDINVFQNKNHHEDMHANNE